MAGISKRVVSLRQRPEGLPAHDIKLEALRLLGTMLKETPRNTGTVRRGSKMEPRDTTPTLSDLGLDKKTSMLAQREVVSLTVRQEG